MKKIIKALALVLALVMVLGFAACGGTDEPAPDQSNPTLDVNTDINEQGGVEVTDPETTEETVYADELVLAVGDFSTANPLNPAFVASQISNILPMVYDGLVARHPSGEYTYKLAKEITTEDYKTWHVVLRDDAYFHNGEKFTAQDVVDTIAITMENHAVASSKWMVVDHIDIINDYEMDIVLTNVMIDFMANLGDPLCAIFNKKALEEDPENGMMIGTGPWVFEEAIPQNYVTLVKNENYWGEPAKAEKFTMKVVLETTVQVMMLINGELDFAGVDATMLADCEAAENVVVDTFYASNTGYLGFNLNNPITGDINFRKAVAYCLDVESVALIASDGYMIPWDTGSYWGGPTAYKADIPAREQDLDKAREYLAASSYNGEEVEIMASMAHLVAQAEVLQTQMEAIGINVKVFQTDFATSMATTGWGSTDWDMMVNASVWTRLASSCSLCLKYMSTGNKAQWNNERVQELLVLGDVTPDGPEREAIYVEIQEIIAEEIPYIGIGNGANFHGRQATCGGVLMFEDNCHNYAHAYRVIEE